MRTVILLTTITVGPRLLRHLGRCKIDAIIRVDAIFEGWKLRQNRQNEQFIWFWDKKRFHKQN